MTIKPYHNKGYRISGTDAQGEPLTMLYLGQTRKQAMRKFIKRMMMHKSDVKYL